MNNAQKTVFTELILILVLKFGIASKAGQLWNLAFTGTALASSGQAKVGVGKP